MKTPEEIIRRELKTVFRTSNEQSGCIIKALTDAGYVIESKADLAMLERRFVEVVAMRKRNEEKLDKIMSAIKRGSVTDEQREIIRKYDKLPHVLASAQTQKGQPPG